LKKIGEATSISRQTISRIEKYYCKCNTPVCRCNKRADAQHAWFKEIISPLTIDINDDYRYLIKLKMIATYYQLTEADREKKPLWKTS